MPTQKGKKLPIQIAQMNKFLNVLVDFQGHFQTHSWWEYPQQYGFEAENNAQTPPKQLQSNFEDHKTTISTPKIAKLRMLTWPTVSIFVFIFGLWALFFAC